MNQIKKVSLTLAVAAIAIAMCMATVPIEQSDAAEPLNGNITYSSEYGLDVTFNDYSEIQGSSVVVTFGTTSFRGATIDENGIAHFEPSVSMLKAGSNNVGVTVIYPDMSGLTDFITTSTIVNIEFNKNSGSGTDLKSVQVTDGYEFLVKDTGWVRGEDEFVGWATSASYDSYTPIGETIQIEDSASHSVTLYAAYGTGSVVDDATVSFVSNGGSEVPPMHAAPGEYIDLPEPSREGYTFSGWYDNEELTGDPVNVHYQVNGDITLYAKWSANPTGYRVDDSQVKKDGYVAGDELDLSYLKVYQTFSDKSEVEVAFTTNPEDGTVLEEGTQTVTVYVGDVSVGSFDIIVGAAVVESIEVTTPPTKTVYTVGEALDLSGLVVIAKYSDGTTSIVTGYITDPVAGAILNTAGSQTVTVTYEGKTTSFAITVNPDETTVGPTITVDTNLGGKVVSSGSVDNGDGTYTVTVVVAPTTGFTVYNVYVSNGYTYETEGMPEDINDIVTAGNVTITIYGVTDSVDVDVTFIPLILDDDDDDPTNPPVVVDPKEDDNSVVIVAIAAGVVVAILAALILMHTRKN